MLSLNTQPLTDFFFRRNPIILKAILNNDSSIAFFLWGPGRLFNVFEVKKKGTFISDLKIQVSQVKENSKKSKLATFLFFPHPFPSGYLIITSYEGYIVICNNGPGSLLSHTWEGPWKWMDLTTRCIRPQDQASDQHYLLLFFLECTRFEGGGVQRAGKYWRSKYHRTGKVI